MKKTFVFAVAGLMIASAFAAPRGPGGRPGPGPGRPAPGRHARPPAPPRRAPPPPAPRHHHHHHHKHSKTWAVGAGILGAGLLASTIYEATRPDPVIVTQPTVVTPAPVVVTPAPVVVAQPVATGHYETRVQNVWVEGRYVDQVVNGVVQRVWQPGHYEQQQTQVWVAH